MWSESQSSTINARIDGHLHEAPRIVTIDGRQHVTMLVITGQSVVNVTIGYHLLRPANPQKWDCISAKGKLWLDASEYEHPLRLFATRLSVTGTHRGISRLPNRSRPLSTQAPVVPVMAGRLDGNGSLASAIRARDAARS